MVYLFYGTEEYFIKKEVKTLIQNSKIDSVNISYYNLENSLLDDIIEDAYTFSLFDEQKVIVVENSYIFTGTVNKKNPVQDLTVLEKYLDHLNPNTILIFSIVREKIDSRKKITSKIKKIGVVKEFNESKNIYECVRNMFSNYHISNQNLHFFCDRVGDNLLLLEQEVEKMKVYKGDQLDINEEDILNITTKYVNVDVFQLIDDIIHQNKEKAMESYYEMLKLGEEPIKIMITLANQIRLIYQSKQFSKQGYREKDIAEILNVHPYRVKLAISKGYSYSSEVLLRYLYQLAQMDIDIKTGKADKNFALEMFILTI